MKQLALLAAVLFVVGCSAPAEVAQSENARLKEQVKSLENERDQLKKQVGGSLDNVGDIKVGREQAEGIARSNAPSMEVKSWKKVEFGRVSVYLIRPVPGLLMHVGFVSGKLG